MDCIHGDDVIPSVRRMVEQYGDAESCGKLIALQAYANTTSDGVVTLWQAGDDTVQYCLICRREILSGCLYEGILIFSFNDDSEITQTKVVYCAAEWCKKHWRFTHQRFSCSPESKCAVWHMTVGL